MRTGRRWARGLFWGSLCVYLATAYGGIRSPDAEILFEACDALKERRSFAVEPVSAWEGFGLAEGRDGRLHSIFGPLLSLACVPLLHGVDALELGAFWAHPPPSHYLPGGLASALRGEAPADPGPHARRALVAWIFNSLVSAGGVALFFRIARRLATGSTAPAAVTIVYAFGTLTWPYAGTFFSEPLATLLVMASFERLTAPGARGAAVSAGLWLGLAVWTHVTAILFAPFFLFLATRDPGGAPSPARFLRFGGSLALVLLGLGAYHFALYGDPFETGRGGDYATFVPPWRGLYGLLLSPGKGLFLHVPVAALAVWAWPAFSQRHRRLALVLGGCLLARLLFIASRSDWHGGFSAGPRLLVQAVPFLLLALVPWLESRPARPRAVLGFSLASLLSFAIQWSFVAGEPFAVLHTLRLEALAQGVNLFAGDRLYLAWPYALVPHLLGGPIGSLGFRWLETPLALWSLGILLALPPWFLATSALMGRRRPLEMKRYAPIFLAAATLALFAPTLANGFTNWDDPQYVEKNPFASRGLLGIPLAFLGAHEDAYYPVTHAIYSLIQAFFGTSALAHHAVQVGIFAAGVALLPWALLAFGVPRAAGVGIALLWAVHPMRPESVSWVANLKDTAGFLGLVVAFGAYHQGRRRLSAVAFASAVLAKSAFFPLAGLFLLLEKRGTSWRAAARRALPYLAIAGAVALLGAYLHALPSAERGRTQPGGSLLAAIPSVLWLPWWYLGRIVGLRPPQSVYTFDPVAWLDARLFFAVGAWSLVALWIARLPREKRPPWVLGLAAWTLPLLPVTGLVPLVQHVADRYTFLPSLALASGVVLGLRWLAPRLPRWAPAGALAAAIGGQALATIPRQLDYRSAITLWEADLPREPENWTVHNNLAGAYGGVGRWSDAIRHLEAAQAIRPSLETERWLAFARLAEAGVPDEEILGFVERLEEVADPTVVWLEVARALVDAGKLSEARRVLEGIPRDRAEVLFFLAMVASAEGESEPALDQVNEAIARDPGLEAAHLFRASLLAGLGRDEELVRLAEVELAGSRERALLAKERAMAFLRMRRFEEALAATEVEVDEAHRPILSGARAAALLLLGRADEALRVAQAGDGPGADRALLESVMRSGKAEP